MVSECIPTIVNQSGALAYKGCPRFFTIGTHGMRRTIVSG
jgi:hypothetical protein